MRLSRPAIGSPTLAAALLAATACGSGPAGPGDGGDDGGDGGSASLALEEVVSGLESPVHLTSPTGDDRLFIVEKAGRIRIVRDGVLLPDPFLDLVDRVGSSGFEQGLLSLAFHPQHATTRHLFVNFTDLDGDTRVERYTVGPDPDRADPASAKLILGVDQPFANHNGGLLVFGPDGKLYVGLGDGGGAGDPDESGQDRSTLLGSVLRIDVDGGDPYAIPPDNPFVGRPGMRGEIWAWGLRNPWRFAFDEPGGTLYIADVGQNRFEEVNAEPASASGLNYGWNVMEGTHCFDPPEDCERTGLTPPVLEYEHGTGGVCSVTGGFVYRGDRVPGIRGHYFYSDFCAGFLRSFRLEDGRAVDRREWEVGSLGPVTSFGEDAAGELYILSDDGKVFRVVPAG